jgi:hypothetical protein
MASGRGGAGSERLPGTAVGAGELGDREDVGAGELAAALTSTRVGSTPRKKRKRKELEEEEE